MTMQLVLASTSPRRAELLRQLGLRFVVAAPHPDAEPRLPERCSLTKVRAAVPLVALAKARDVAAGLRGTQSFIVGSDTTVHWKGHVLGKPDSAEQAIRYLSSLSGQMHRVFTACALIDARDGGESTHLAETQVYFRRLSRSVIERYVATGEPLDKAGSYGMQGLGGLLVEKIQGRSDTVVGLSTAGLEALLEPLHLSCYDFRE
jgi:septum formation protein